MTEKQDKAQELAEKAASDESVLLELIENLAGASRRARQQSASALAQVAKNNPELVTDHADAIIDALNRPEAQTRWECLAILHILIAHDTRTCDKAISGAELALFDEDSGLVRLAAMRFICTLGATTENRSEKVWPLIDEAIQCFHGDLEFPDMLVAVADFSAGKIAPSVKENLIERMRFDAESGKGALKRRAQLIIDNAS